MIKDDFLKRLGKRIIELRLKKGWTQSEFARRCLKDRQTIMKVESGKMNPSAYFLHELAQALGINKSQLMEF